ncbi:hypothetical protein E4656_13790 [Natronospirillum operosum]|uniref:Uncharacterized protein n=1 Tax=Natronospirillum operosum TaxID=2759953 RepID=A0A4Z0WAC3_9GAMM|nr:hypothetical protein [Natronospirillum operosum]TGG92536.1 hypothetical protein E4656_13790 [Natronospirillum operosum]
MTMTKQEHDELREQVLADVSLAVVLSKLHTHGSIVLPEAGDYEMAQRALSWLAEAGYVEELHDGTIQLTADGRALLATPLSKAGPTGDALVRMLEQRGNQLLHIQPLLRQALNWRAA